MPHNQQVSWSKARVTMRVEGILSGIHARLLDDRPRFPQSRHVMARCNSQGFHVPLSTWVKLINISKVCYVCEATCNHIPGL